MSRALWAAGIFAIVGGLAGIGIGLYPGSRVPPASDRSEADTVAVKPPDPTFNPVFEPCAHCHQIGPGARMTTGPALQGVIGRRAGTLAGYPFSPAIRASGLVWDAPTLDRFIESPQSVAPGTRMIFGGLSDSRQRQAVIDFIVKTNDANPH